MHRSAATVWSLQFLLQAIHPFQQEVSKQYDSARNGMKSTVQSNRRRRTFDLFVANLAVPSVFVSGEAWLALAGAATGTDVSSPFFRSFSFSLEDFRSLSLFLSLSFRSRSLRSRSRRLLLLCPLSSRSLSLSLSLSRSLLLRFLSRSELRSRRLLRPFERERDLERRDRLVRLRLRLRLRHLRRRSAVRLNRRR